MALSSGISSGTVTPPSGGVSLSSQERINRRNLTYKRKANRCCRQVDCASYRTGKSMRVNARLSIALRPVVKCLVANFEYLKACRSNVDLRVHCCCCSHFDLQPLAISTLRFLAGSVAILSSCRYGDCFTGLGMILLAPTDLGVIPDRIVASLGLRIN